uniref:ATP synthase subunit b n=1 Tax=Urechis unicinctus TaxID=6432 RepID=A0A7T7FR27_UREUN|nr:adenosine triphosphate synthase [Urechis unicinctus]
MLSRLALRSGALSTALKAQTGSRALVAIRPSSSGSEQQPSLKEIVNNWDKANALYYGPERDTKNFPHPVQPVKNPATRLGFIPETWFQAFYDKTGVTGPYLLGTGLITALISKELWIVEHSFAEFVAFWIGVSYVISRFGKGLGDTLDQDGEKILQEKYLKPLEASRAEAESTVAELEKAVWREEGQKFIFEAGRENVDLQLEAIYRQRLHDVQTAVKKRLDYQLSKENTVRHVEQEHMVNWIVDGVVRGITPQQEKESLSKCIADLKSLAAKQ